MTSELTGIARSIIGIYSALDMIERGGKLTDNEHNLLGSTAGRVFGIAQLSVDRKLLLMETILSSMSRDQLITDEQKMRLTRISEALRE